MKYGVYEAIEMADKFGIFNFISIGKKGAIPKRISFTKTELDSVYNLAFGDVDLDGEINDYFVSNDGDRNKILATVVKVIGDYTDRYPDRWIFFTGSTNERTRLYRMAVGLYLEELSAKFEIYVHDGEKFMPFAKNLKTNAFLIKKKIL